MIAHRSRCDEDRLSQLLLDTLQPDQQVQVTQHLNTCQACQRRLEQLTAGVAWWSDAQAVLSEIGQPLSSGSVPTQTAAPDIPSAADPTELGQAERAHWVLGLLQPTNDPAALGTLDAMPIHAVIGQGGMGVVLKARDVSLPRYLAIKLLSPMLASSGAARQRFFREAQAAAAVVHPNIVPIYAVSGERDLPYIVMPFIAGGNLQQHLDVQGPLPLHRALSIGLQVAEALVAAHAQGIVHRDIKPANLMLDEGGFRIMLTDFGLARALDDATLTGSGMIAGTPQYMSPEQARGRQVDHRSDLYSLGAVLYALATGRAPFRGDSTLDILRRIGEESPRPVIEINELYPSWFGRIIEVFMHRETEQRIQTAEEAAVLLRGCLAHARSPHQVRLPELARPASNFGSSTGGGLRRARRAAAKLVGLGTQRQRLSGRVVTLVLSGSLLAVASWYIAAPFFASAAPEKTMRSPAEPADNSSIDVARAVVDANDAQAIEANPLAEWDAPAIEQLLEQSQSELESLMHELGREALRSPTPTQGEGE